MKLVHLVSGDLWAGAEVMACHLLKHLNTIKKIELSLILLNNGRLAEEVRSAGIRVHVVDEAKHSFFQLSKAINEILLSDFPNIIHSHRYKENILAWLVSRKSKACKLVTTQHGLPEPYNQRVSVLSRIKLHSNFYVLKHRFHKVVAVSNDIDHFFINHLSFPRKKVEAIHNGIEIPPAVVEQRKKGNITVGSSGRLYPVKDYPLMINIARKLKESSNTHFALAGDGPERLKLEQLVAQKGITSRFVFFGHLNNMGSFYRELDVYLSTSIHEGIPMTILEAMSYGLPIVAPKVGGIPEVVQDGVEGFLIDSRDPSAFVKKLELLAKDRELRKRMSAAARKRAVENFSVERMTQHYLKIYQELLT